MRLPYTCFKQLQGTCTQESFKVLGCLYNCRWLIYGSLQLMHMSRDDHTVQLIKFKRTMAATL